MNREYETNESNEAYESRSVSFVSYSSSLPRIPSAIRLQKRNVHAAVLSLLFLVLVAGRAGGQGPVKIDAETESKARAAELLARARTAAGGAAAIKQVRTLSTTGKYRRYVKYISVQGPKKVVEKVRTIEGNLKFDFAFPDQFRQRIKGETIRGIGYSYADVVSGNDAWRDPPLRPVSSNRDSRVVDVGDVQRTELMTAQEARQQLTLYLFSWMLETLPAFPLDLQLTGRFETDQGPGDVILAMGKGGFSFYLVLDAKTSILTQLVIPFIETRQPIILVEAAGYFDRRFMQETFARARAERQSRRIPQEKRELQMRFSDRRPVAGVMLPHKITMTIDGEIYEEMTFEEFDLNRPINPKNFAPPKQKDKLK
jgi:hypothetical protein